MGYRKEKETIREVGSGRVEQYRKREEVRINNKR